MVCKENMTERDIPDKISQNIFCKLKSNHAEAHILIDPRCTKNISFEAIVKKEQIWNKEAPYDYEVELVDG